MSKILKNNTASPQPVADIGVEVPASGQLTIEPADYQLAAGSSDVITLLAAGTLTYNDGSADLALVDAVNHLAGYQVKELSVNAQPGIAEPFGLRARVIGSHLATVPNGSTQNIDWAIPHVAWIGVNKKSYFNGVEYYAAGAAVGDHVTFQVIDKDGVLYPPGAVIEEFATNYYVAPNALNRIVLYKARLIVGLYVRIIYVSTGATDVKFFCNLLRHLSENENA